MGSLSIGHWGLLLVAAFLLLGGTKFSAAMGGIGQGLRSFRNGLADSSSAMDPGKPSDEVKPAKESGSP